MSAMNIPPEIAAYFDGFEPVGLYRLPDEYVQSYRGGVMSVREISGVLGKSQRVVRDALRRQIGRLNPPGKIGRPRRERILSREEMARCE